MLRHSLARRTRAAPQTRVPGRSRHENRSCRGNCHAQKERRTRSPSEDACRDGRDESDGENVGETVAAGGELSPERLRQPIRIGEAARQVGVRVSTLRFWEQQEVLHPSRSGENAHRLFDERELVRLQVVVLLRKARYNFASSRSVLTELSAGRIATALSAVEERKVQLAAESRRCAAATTALWSYLGNR